MKSDPMIYTCAIRAFLVSADKLEEEGLQISMLREENAALRSEVEEDRDVLSQLEEMTDQLRRQRMAHQASLLVGVLLSLSGDGRMGSRDSSAVRVPCS